MLEIANLNFDFGSEDSTVFRRVNLNFQAGELSLLIGPTGSGKSTLLRTINRLSPSFTGGRMSGSIKINGEEASAARPSDLAKQVGYVQQTPETSFVAETVIEELAFGMEQLGIAKPVMLENISRYAKVLGLDQILDSPLDTLSAGQQQRVAIAAGLVAGQKLLLLDEPFSALDENVAAELLRTLRKLATELAITVLITEHRIENLLNLVDSIVILKGDGSAIKRQADWNSVYSTFPDWQPRGTSRVSELQGSRTSNELLLEVNDLTVNYPGSETAAVKAASLRVRKGEIVSLLGVNGSGKTTLLEAIAGQLKNITGTIKLENLELGGLKPTARNKLVSLVPQQASDLLFLNSVGQELQEADELAEVAANTTSKLLIDLIGRINPAIHPRDLSVGQQLALVIAMQVAVGAPLLMLDEPTRGLDYEAKRELQAQLLTVRESGRSVFFVTHDKEFANEISDRQLRIDAGVVSEDNEAAQHA